MPLAMAQEDSLTMSENSTEIEPVEVFGQRSPAVLSEVSRTLTVINREDVEKSGVQNVIDLLEFISNADIRQRGIYGIQADASIRGGSFDHVMILVNGINVSDPQTGHLSLDIPVDHESVERIEILEGPAARVYGPGAFTGAMNIVTKKAGKKDLSASQVFGKYGYSRTMLNAGIKTGLLHNYLSMSHSTSDGYMENTDHRLQNLYYRGTIQKAQTSVDFQAGYQNKSLVQWFLFSRVS
jgi:iron complex outermembrane receptor protein